MEKIITIPEEYRVDQKISIKDIFKGESRVIEEIKYIGHIESNDSIYEKIDIILVRINDVANYINIVKPIFKINQPCIIMLEYGDKYKIAACRLHINKKNKINFTDKDVKISQWIREEYMSNDAIECIDRVNEAINSDENIEQAYEKAVRAIASFKQTGLTKARLCRVISFLYETEKEDKFEKIMKYSSYINYYEKDNIAISPNRNGYEGQYLCIYDNEEIWYCLMKCDGTNKALKNYSSIVEVLLYMGAYVKDCGKLYTY